MARDFRAEQALQADMSKGLSLDTSVNSDLNSSPGVRNVVVNTDGSIQTRPGTFIVGDSVIPSEVVTEFTVGDNKVYLVAKQGTYIQIYYRLGEKLYPVVTLPSVFPLTVENARSGIVDLSDPILAKLLFLHPNAAPIQLTGVALRNITIDTGSVTEPDPDPPTYTVGNIRLFCDSYSYIKSWISAWSVYLRVQDLGDLDIPFFQSLSVITDVFVFEQGAIASLGRWPFNPKILDDSGGSATTSDLRDALSGCSFRTTTTHKLLEVRPLGNGWSSMYITPESNEVYTGVELRPYIEGMSAAKLFVCVSLLWTFFDAPSGNEDNYTNFNYLNPPGLTQVQYSKYFDISQANVDTAEPLTASSNIKIVPVTDVANAVKLVPITLCSNVQNTSPPRGRFRRAVGAWFIRDATLDNDIHYTLTLSKNPS